MSSIKFRYSTGILDPNDAPEFAWEYPVPINDFWNSFRYITGRNFLTCFSQQEIFDMNLEQHNNSSNKQKAAILLASIEEKITALETLDRPLWETDFATWQKLMQAEISVYGELKLLDKEIEAEEEVINKRGDKYIPAHANGLAYLLTKRGRPGDFEKAEELERNAQEWFDLNLGKDSPQAMSVRRVIITAVWGQQRHTEAEELIAEMYQLIEHSERGEYWVYRNVERQLVDKLVDGLKGQG
ncbi:hypothetical protein PVAG01_05844 [Phlyctema vagabunda]|uniref:Uncharacterized protein n=1 Tax=Phlyctema vagabunda TaxID=108571 RepID=A0ABR4PEG1_9HELO